MSKLFLKSVCRAVDLPCIHERNARMLLYRHPRTPKLRMLGFVLLISWPLDGVGGSVCLEAIKALPPASHSHRSSRACPLPLPRWPRAETACRRVSSSGGRPTVAEPTSSVPSHHCCSNLWRREHLSTTTAAVSHEVVRQKSVFRNFSRQGLFVAKNPKRNTNCKL